MNEKVLSILKGAAVAAVGAALTYLTQAVSGADFGQLTPAIVAALSILVNVIRKVVMPDQPEVK